VSIDSFTKEAQGSGVGPREISDISWKTIKLFLENAAILTFFKGKKGIFLKLLARTKRHFISGYIWHITHRCHKREFLLKFAKDRHRYLQWLYQARKKYGLKILNYFATLKIEPNQNNHITNH